MESSPVPPSARKRARVVDEYENQRLSLGTFALGTSIYRNRLHAGELIQDGHVTIGNLVLPGTASALCTTFVAPDPAWLDTFLNGVDELIVVQHDLRTDNRRVIGDAEILVTTPAIIQSKKPAWFTVVVQPHTGGCLHAKMMLFRCPTGLRVVVCGSNLYQEQWEGDRDSLWVQDFYCYSRSEISVATPNAFETRLKSFLEDLTKCRDASDQKLLSTQLEAILEGINFETAAARLVFSFPRPKGDSKSRGGWCQLAESIQKLVKSNVSADSIDTAKNEPVQVHALAGSFGNVGPDFLLQMHRAMLGTHEPAPKKTPWAEVENLGLRCLWPSRRTALSMNFHSLINNVRAMPMKYWKTIPETARRKIFFDAPPNPTEMGLPHMSCHPVSHAKILLKTGGGSSVIYVGSHNFSKAAWGLRGAMPINVELGVVLATSLLVQEEWRRRLPCLLPEPGAESPSTYVPASAHMGVREAYQSGDRTKSFQLLTDHLNST